MLRAFVIAVAVALICGGAALITHHARFPGWQLIVFGLLVLVGTVFERWRYRGPEHPPPGPWQGTGERFIDPTTGQPIKVQFDPRTGERRYVPDSSSDKPPQPDR